MEDSAREANIRAQILNAQRIGNCKEACRLMESGFFRDGSDLIKVWDVCQYAIQEQTSKRPLTALSRYRVRHKYPPPKSICPSGLRTKNTLSTSTRETLMNYYQWNTKYPSTDDKIALAERTGLSRTQVHNWFANRRRKRKQKDSCDLGDVVQADAESCVSSKLNKLEDSDLANFLPVARSLSSTGQMVNDRGNENPGLSNTDTVACYQYNSSVLEAIYPSPWHPEPAMPSPYGRVCHQEMASYMNCPLRIPAAQQQQYAGAFQTQGGYSRTVGGLQSDFSQVRPELKSHQAGGGTPWSHNPLTMLHTAAEFVANIGSAPSSAGAPVPQQAPVSSDTFTSAERNGYVVYQRAHNGVPSY